MTEEISARPQFPVSTDMDASVPEHPATIEIATGEPTPTGSTPDISPDLEELYHKYCRELGRIAYLLTSNLQDAEDVVADVFLRVAERYDVRNISEPLAFLRAAVVNSARSKLRHRVVQDKYLPRLAPGEQGDSTSESALAAAESSIVTQALRGLPMRQRQAIVLRYYAELSENDIAATMGVRPGSVKSHTSRGLATLRRVLDPYFQQF
jgi:RNA polymerase sigma-70 factor (sigma-E family)